MHPVYALQFHRFQGKEDDSKMHYVNCKTFKELICVSVQSGSP